MSRVCATGELLVRREFCGALHARTWLDQSCNRCPPAPLPTTSNHRCPLQADRPLHMHRRWAAASKVTLAPMLPTATSPPPFRLTNRSLPCIAVGNGKVILPPELCTIAPGQASERCPGRLAARRHAGWMLM